VLGKIKQDDLRSEMTETAYRDIVQSGNYSYRQFVDFVISRSLHNFEEKKKDALSRKIWVGVIYWWMRFADFMDRLIGKFHGHILTPLRQRVLGR